MEKGIDLRERLSAPFTSALSASSSSSDYGWSYAVFECAVFECSVFECSVFECAVFECAVFECADLTESFYAVRTSGLGANIGGGHKKQKIYIWKKFSPPVRVGVAQIATL